VRNRIFPLLALFLVTALLSGCAVLPFFPIIGPAYDGYGFWNSGKATKYYAFDLDTTYLAVMRASDRLKLEVTLIKSAPKEGYSLETKGNVPMHIDVLPLKKEKSVTTVAIRIPIFSDKQYVELFYRLVDDNLSNEGCHKRRNHHDFSFEIQRDDLIYPRNSCPL
jgi:hypothetical protein